jgi:hypothetical protein
MLYNNVSLENHCIENDIELLEDYANIKINREFYVKGVCKTVTENCDKVFNKNFRQLVKTGPYCLKCAIENGKQQYKLKCKYNLDYLITFCNENNITLNEDYTNKFINRDTIIEGICITTDCNAQFSRTFRELIKLNGYCASCCKERGKIKIIKTNLKKYGVEYSLQSQIVRNKGIETTILKYGVDHISKLNSIKEQKKEKSIDKYGVEYPLQSQIVRNKSIETNKIKYGCENPQQNTEIKNKTLETNLKKYGHKHLLNNPEIKEKIIKTNMERYGVPHHSQNSIISERMLMTAYKNKEYVMPSGKTITYQGYENFAFERLLKEENVLEEDIITNRKDVPEIWYVDKNGKKRRHFVDIYIKCQNRCIEVKSTWTNQEKNNVFEKQMSAIELGYKYEIWIFDKNGNILGKP